MPACPHCGHSLSSDDLGALLSGVSDRTAPAAPSLEASVDATSLGCAPYPADACAIAPLGPADARGPESTSDVSFGL